MQIIEVHMYLQKSGLQNRPLISKDINFVKAGLTVPPKNCFEISISLWHIKWVNYILVIVYILFVFLQMILTFQVSKWQKLQIFVRKCFKAWFYKSNIFTDRRVLLNSQIPLPFKFQVQWFASNWLAFVKKYLTSMNC